MKRIIIIIMALALVVPSMNAQNKALQKALKKEYTVKKKELKKGKWELYASSRTIDVALLKHFDKLNELGENGYEVVGVAPKFKSKNVGHQQAVNNACLTYAQQAGSNVKGRVVSDMASDGVDPSNEFDHFYAAYERLVESEIKGELQESFSIIRQNSDGTYEMQTYFIVNQEAATKARIRAYENALKESEAAQKYATKVADFVREGFKNDK